MPVILLGLMLVVGGCGGGDAGEETALTEDGSWDMYGKDYTNQRYSPLSQINAENVANLKLAWEQSLGIEEAQECTPIIVDGTMFVTTSNGPKYVHAFDAKTGEKKWTKEFTIPDDVARFACCGIVNRGASYADGKIFVGRLDGKLTALNAQTGEEIWTAQVVDYQQGSVITSPPLVVGNKVISGFGGGEYGATSYLSAYDVSTGEQVWKTLTIPGEEVEAVAASWKGDSWKTGGAAPWFIGSYDPQLNLVYWGTSNPSPWSSSLRGPDTHEYGDVTNLYSASTLAINPDNGSIQWHYQTTPYDAWDYDGVNEMVLAELNINGQATPVAMKADRNGFFYTLDRRDGKLLSANKFVKVNWAEGIDLESGRPIENPTYRLTTKNQVSGVFPSFMGGKNWQPMAYNPQTGLVYIPANHVGMDFKSSEVNYQRGYFYLGAEWAIVYEDGPVAEYIAWDPVKGEKVWGAPQDFPIPGGPVTTAGNLVFFGNLTGTFYAYNATTGQKLWEYKATSGIGAAAMTYAVDGKQYVAIVEGRPSVIPGFLGGEMGESMVSATPAGGKVLVFSL